MPSQQEIVETVARQLQGKDLSQQAVMVLQKATARVLERIKQNVDAQVKEDSSPIVDKFVRNAGTKMSAMTQQWADGVKNDLVVFPEGTRYIYRDGQMTTIILEQAPQVRHISMKHADGSIKVYLLSMPYVQFVLTFQNHKFNGHVRVGCTKKPISDLDQPMHHLPLPNIDDNHNVCMGSSVSNNLTTLNMTDAVNAIVGGFWQSVFTYDNAAQFGKFLSENKLEIDAQRAASHREGCKAWEEKSKADGLYTVSKAKLFPGATFRRFLVSDQNSKDGTTSIVNNLKQEILTAIGSIGGDIQALLTTLDLKTENREKSHVETLQTVLKEIIVQAYAELWEYLQKQLTEERAKLQTEMQAAANKLRQDFLYHMDKKKVW